MAIEQEDNFMLKIYWNILTKAKKSNAFSSFIDTIIERGNNIFGEKFNETLMEDWSAYVDSLEEHLRPRLISYAKMYHMDPEKYKNIVKETHPNIDEQEMFINDDMLVLKDLLDLDDNEIKILQFAFMYENLGYSTSQPLVDISMDGEYKSPRALYSLLFNMSKQDITKVFKGFLFRSGFVSQNEFSKPYYSINEEIVSYFTGYKLEKETIEDKLFPTVLTSNLSTKMYPHLEKEVNIAKNVLSYSIKNKVKGTNILFWGLAGTGKTELALALGKESGFTVRSVGDISPENQEELSRTKRIVSLKLAMKIYEKRSDVILLFDEMEDITKVVKSTTDEQYSKSFINRIIETSPVPIVWTTNEIFVLGQAILRRMDYSIEFGVPNAKARSVIWKKYAKEFNLSFTKKDLQFLSHNFDIIPAAIRNAASIANSSKLTLDETVETIKNFDTLLNFGRERHFNITKNSDTPYDLSVINTDIDVKNFVKQIKKAKPRWSLCLYGPPGTGKSEFGRHLGEEVEKLILFKRASDLESMWVGETEKNIAKAFKEASQEGKILLIDEADTFFKARSSGNKSWENSKVNEILSQMETHDQPFIVTTNLFDSFDPASLRRFTFKFKFDFLKPEDAKKLFKEYFHKTAPKEILTQTFLAPGDFSNVKKKIDILNIEDENEIYKLLLEEVAVKGESKGKIGF